MQSAENNMCDILTEIEFASLANEKITEVSKYIACLHENHKASRSSIRVIQIISA